MAKKYLQKIIIKLTKCSNKGRGNLLRELKSVVNDLVINIEKQYNMMEKTKKFSFNEVKKHLELLFKFQVILELSKNLGSWDIYYEEIKKELIEECKQFYFKFPLIKENIIKDLGINCINIIKSYIDGRIELIIF
uniref:Uncharacterized protein n=1 Tax=Meloidogyne enterolobii TaxID=390850 RepID=A0A6V7WK60_MELEN|nr:unnamed protein product [Meloidogyne enterolobii]